MNRDLGRDCLEEGILEDIALGVYPPEKVDLAVQHATLCKRCASSLREYLRIFSDEALPEEAEILNQLKSASPEWRRQWLREHTVNSTADESRTPSSAGSSDPQQGTLRIAPSPRWPRWWKRVVVVSGAMVTAAGLALAGGPTIILMLQIHSVQNKLAAAWSEYHSTDIRLPGVPYAPRGPQITVQGAEHSETEYGRPALDKAKAAVSDKLKPGDDPRWLQLAGRISLLRATSQSITEADGLFKKARETGLDTPSLEIDLASAEYAGELDKHPDHPDLRPSIDLLNKVLDRSKLSRDDRKVALFNLAIAYERTNLWDLALQTWEKYLREDPVGPWAEVARQHRDNAKSKEERDPGNPESFLERFFRQDLGSEDAELYQQLAITSWLPHAVEDRSSNSYLAASKLGDELKKKLPIPG